MIKLCDCGCGQPAPISTYTWKDKGYVKGEPRRFIHGHHTRITAPDGKRWCSGCQDFRSLDTFSPKARSYCRVCANNKRQEWLERNPEQAKRHNQNKHLKKRYSITVDEYDMLFEAQEGACAICGDTPDSTLHVDHDHLTGEVRGLLCNTCNIGIGTLRDNPEVLRAAANYLEEHNGRLAATA